MVSSAMHFDFVWRTELRCWQCVQMPAMCLWPLAEDGFWYDESGIPILVCGNPLVRTTHETFFPADEQVIRWSDVMKFTIWCCNYSE